MTESKEIANTESKFVITKNIPPSEWVSIEGQRVRVVSHHHGESFLLLGEFKALGDGVVESNCLMERHVRPAVMVSLVDTAT